MRELTEEGSLVKLVMDVVVYIVVEMMEKMVVKTGFWKGRRKEVVVKVYGVGVGGEGVEKKIWCQVGSGGVLGMPPRRRERLGAGVGWFYEEEEKKEMGEG